MLPDTVLNKTMDSPKGAKYSQRITKVNHKCQCIELIHKPYHSNSKPFKSFNFPHVPFK